MARFSEDLFVRNSREANLVQYANGLAKKIERTAGIHDEKGTFPFEHYQLLKEEGFFKLPIPKKYGGEEISLYEMLLIQEQLAKGDGSTALNVGWHLLTFMNVRELNAWSEPVFARLCHTAVEKGELINIINTERVKGNLSRGGSPGTVAKKVPGGYQISGRKSFASLAPILNHFTIIAYLEDEEITAEFLIEKTDKVKVIETWESMGMRGTGSHDIEIQCAFVPEEALLVKHKPNEETRFDANSRIYSLEIPAVYLGIAGAARDYAIYFAHSTYSHSLGDYIKTAGHIRQKIGEIELLYKSSRSVLYSIAERFESDPLLKDRLSDEVSMVKHVVCHNAIKIVELALRIVGGSGLSRKFKLERLFRDVQCGLFNPPQDDVVIEQLTKAAFKKLTEQREESLVIK
ncbi:acyl-CoA dehydrogenase family protein [Cytobacillus sp. Hz8]|uniref:acyl-CoA dehydrogenase family protein n=1 Tax=Cytobacillus sp. Hz8 TaxID=3347168 RepID=UPI0035D5BC1C